MTSDEFASRFRLGLNHACELLAATPDPLNEITDIDIDGNRQWTARGVDAVLQSSRIIFFDLLKQQERVRRGDALSPDADALDASVGDEQGGIAYFKQWLGPYFVAGKPQDSGPVAVAIYEVLSTAYFRVA